MIKIMAWSMTLVFLIAGAGYLLYLPFVIYGVYRDFNHMEGGYWWKHALSWPKIVCFSTLAAGFIAIAIFSLLELL